MTVLPRSIASGLRFLTCAGALSFLPWLSCRAQETAAIDSIPVSVIVSDYEELLKQVSYSWEAGGGEGVTNRSSSYTKQGVAMLVARTQLKDVSEELLDKLTEQLAANSLNTNLKLVTLSDLSANFREAKAAGPQKGSLLDFSNNQNVLNEAVSRGIAMVLFVDVTHLNGKPSTVPGAKDLNILSVRASLTLLNAADGNRIKSINKDVKVRGFDGSDLIDKGFDLLAKDLSAESAKWKLQDLQIRLVQLEVHAKMDGIQFPMMDIDRTGQIQLHEVPLFAEGASVEINGILKGKAPCRIDVAPGTHRLKVYRDGTKPFEAVIQVNTDNRYDALLVPSDETRRKFDEQLKKFEAVKTMAMNRNVVQERETVRTDGIRATVENARLMGRAAADVTQSRADVLRKDADSRGQIAAGRRDVLEGKADAIRKDADSRGEIAAGQRRLLEGNSDATRKDADSRGELAAGGRTLLEGKADALRKDADARDKIASGEAAVLNGEAAILNERSRGEANIANAKAEAMRKAAEGQLELDKANAKETVPVLKARLETVKEQSAAFKSFAESVGAMGFKLAVAPRLSVP
jgi:hypothetical protein